MTALPRPKLRVLLIGAAAALTVLYAVWAGLALRGGDPEPTPTPFSGEESVCPQRLRGACGGMRAAYRNHIRGSIVTNTGTITLTRGPDDVLQLELVDGRLGISSISSFRNRFLSDLWEVVSQDRNHIRARGPCGINVTCETTVQLREAEDVTHLDAVMIGTILCEGDDLRLCADTWGGSWEAVQEPLPLGGGIRWFSREPDGSVHWTLREMRLVGSIPDAVDLLADHLTTSGWQIDLRTEGELRASGPCSEAVDCQAIVRFEIGTATQVQGTPQERERPLVYATVIGTKSPDYTPELPRRGSDDD